MHAIMFRGTLWTLRILLLMNVIVDVICDTSQVDLSFRCVVVNVCILVVYVY